MSGLAKALSSKTVPRLLKTGAVTALTCLALGHTSAQAQTKTSLPASVVPVAVQLGIPQLGPAPIKDVPVPDICWKPGTPAAQIAAAERQHSAKSGAIDSVASPFRVLGQGRWSRTATNGGGLTQGTPTTITYSFVPDGLIIPGRPSGNDATGPSNLQARLNQIYGSRQVWLQQFAAVGAALSAQTGLTYVYEPNDDGAPFGTESPGQLGVRGDMRISGRRIDGDEGGILAYNYSPDFGDMVIDTPDTFYNDISSNSLNLRNVVTHEFGHGLGLAHTCPINTTKLMEPTVTRNFDGPQFDDNRGLQRFYGDRLDNNDTAETATDLGPLSNGTLSRSFVSIDGTSDVDFFRFTLPPSRGLTINVTPSGAPYLEGPQNDDGSCSAGALFDPKTVNDLGFELLTRTTATGPLTVVRTGNSAAIGEQETISTSAFPAGGEFLVRVFGGTVDQVQTYDINFIVGPPGSTPEPTPTPTPPPAPIRPVADLNGLNPDGTAGQNSPVANGIDVRSDYAEGGGPQVVAPGTIVLSDISKGSTQPILPGDNIVEARVRIAIFPEEPVNINQPGAPDNRGPVTGNDIEVLDIPKVTRDFLNGLLGRPPSGLTIAYDNGTQTLTITGGRPGNAQDFNRESYEIALSNITYENKAFRGNTTPALNRRPRLRGGIDDPDRFITYVVDTDNDATNNRDDRFRSPQEGPDSNQKQSRVATANLFIGDPQSLIVTTLDDTTDPQDEENSLREAINFANIDGKDSAITFAPFLFDERRGGPATITLNSALPQLFDANAPTPNNVRTVIKTSITGPGARLLNINAAGNGAFVTITDDLTVASLSVSRAGGSGVSSTNGNLTINACQISNSSASGILSFNTNQNAARNLTVTNSAIIRNNGGGIQAINSAAGALAKTTVITNSTISANNGTGVFISSRAINVRQGQVADATGINYSTVGGNTGNGVTAGSNSIVTLNNTIVYNSGGNDVVANGAGNGGTNIDGVIVSANGNSVGTGNATPAFTMAADTVGVDPQLVALANNGGNTDTQRLPAGSPARDSGAAPAAGVTAPATDQRGTGFPRVFNTTVDKGAYEAQQNNFGFTVTLAPRNPVRGTRLVATATSTNDGQPLAAPDVLTYRFLINGNQRQIGPSNVFTVPQNANDGDVVTVVVARNEADTRDVAAPQATDSVTVRVNNANTPPSITSVTFTPNPPLTNDKVTATPQATDAEGNAFTFSYRWSVNGVALAETSNTLDLSVPGQGDRGDRITVVVTATETQAGGLSSAPFSATVNIGNTAPTANDVTFDAVAGQTTEVVLTGSDPDADDVLSFSIVTGPTKGTAEIQRRNDGRYVLVYTANADATGTDTIVFKATDNATASSAPKDSANATATANFGPVTPPANPNRPPVAASTTLNAKREVPVTKGLAASDPDPDDVYSNLTLKRVFGPRKGTGEIRKDTDGTWKLFYKASGLFTGNDEVRFVAIDSKGAVSNVATITINLLNTAPTARSTSMQVAAGGSASVGLFGQDVDRDDLTFQRVGGPSKGSGEIRRDANGNFRFYYQNSPTAIGDDVVQFVALDGKPGGVSEIATINITVVGIFNRAPKANNVSGSTQKNQSVAVAVSGSDPDEDDTITFKRVSGPTNGTGDIRPDGKGGFEMFYTPRTNFVGVETIRYVAIDSKGRPSPAASITINVTGIPNRAPSAQNVSGTTTQGQSVSVPLVGTDPDKDDTITFKRVGGPVNGSGGIQSDGNGGFVMFYVPRADFVGTETIRYIAIDSSGRTSEVATITITVTSSTASAIKSNPSPSAGNS